jgi:hypothetical protein
MLGKEFQTRREVAEGLERATNEESWRVLGLQKGPLEMQSREMRFAKVPVDLVVECCFGPTMGNRCTQETVLAECLRPGLPASNLEDWADRQVRELAMNWG